MGLALGDLAQIRKNAVILRLQMQVSLHESLERLFPRRWIVCFRKKTEKYRYYPGRPVDLITWVRMPVCTGLSLRSGRSLFGCSLRSLFPAGHRGR